MASLDSCYWLTLEEENNETENQDEAVETALPTPDGVGVGETADPDFIEVSNMLTGQNRGSETAEPTVTPEAVETETVDYTTYLENISVQIGVLDVCIVLYLLIWVIKQFVRVPR